MDYFHVALITAAFLCSLLAGFLFAFAVVVMPGIRNLNDKEYIRAFQVMDLVIQNNQPIFMLVWVGSLVALFVSVVAGFEQLNGLERLLMVVTVLVSLLGIHLPTITINIPLNNKLQSLDVNASEETTLKAARESFEPRWNRWNLIRTVLSCLVSALLIVLLYKV